MRTFEITIERGAGGATPAANGAASNGEVQGWPVVVQYADGGGLPVRSEGELQLAPEALRSARGAQAYGALLGDAVFRGRVRDAFNAARVTLGASGKVVGGDGTPDPLRVLLHVEAPELWGLRWERLCGPSVSAASGWGFLRLDQQAPLSLYLPSLTDRRFPPIGRRELRALVLVAAPSGLEQFGLGPIDVPSTVASVRAALGEIPCDVLATGGDSLDDASGPATLDTLCGRLTAAPYTLLHVVAHGQFIRRGPQQGETVLYLANAEGGVEPVPATRLVERLGRLGGAQGLPRLAFLATCESATAEAEGALGGLGQRLVRELGMPAVVAMTEPVTITTAQALAQAFYARLRAHGEPDRALSEASAGLAGRADITVPALFSRLGGRPLFDDALDRPLRSTDIAHALDVLGGEAGLVAQRAPAMRVRFDELASVLRGTLSVEVAALEPAVRAEREAALAELDVLAREATDVSFAALALGREAPAYDTRCPFRGLYPFRPADREFFVGREALIERLVGRLTEHTFLAALGPSGCGKSSVVFAGLVPVLERAWPGLRLITCTPGDAPLARLEAALAEDDGVAASLVVIDQFEEAFTLCADERERRAFFARVLALAGERPVVVTMRADFWGECAPYPALRAAMQAHQELIAPMDATELRRSVEEQAKKVGLRFEADVINRMLEDVAQEPGAMPLLQHALLELWKRRHGRWLKAEEYRALGGVAQAIARTADELYEQLSDAERLRARDVFLRLTRLGDESGGDGARRDTRQRVRLSELVPPSQNEAERVTAETATSALLSRLAGARLVVTSHDAASDEDQAEVAHEALIRYWPRLRTWLDESRAALRLRAGIREAAREWEAGGRDDALLVHRGARLDEAMALARGAALGGGIGLNAGEAAYVEACAALRERDAREREERRRREVARLRQFLMGVGAAALLAVGVSVFAFVQWTVADQKTNSAQALALAAAALGLDETDPELATLLALEAVNLDPSARTEQALRSAVRRTHLLTALPLENSPVRLELSPDGKRIILHTFGQGGPDGRSGEVSVEVWDIETKRRVASLPRSAMSGLEAGPAASWLTADRMAVQAADSPEVRVVEIATGRVLATLAGGPNHTTSVALSPDGTRVVTTGSGDVVRVWDVATAAQVATFDGHRADPASYSSNSGPWAVFSADGSQVMSFGADGVVRIWVTATGEQVGELRDPRGPLSAAIPSPDLRVVLGVTLHAGSESDAHVWDVSRRGVVAELKPPPNTHSAVFSPDGTIVASPTTYGLGVWSVRDVAKMPLAPASPPELRAQKVWFDAHEAVFTRDGGRALILFGTDFTRRLRTVDDGTNLATLVTPVERRATQFLSMARLTPDGRLAVTLDWDFSVRLWDMRPDREVGALDVGATVRDGVPVNAAFADGGTIQALVWSPDVSGRVGRAALARFKPDGTPLGEVRLGTSSVQFLTGLNTRFSPDGSRLLRWEVESLPEQTAPGRATGTSIALFDTTTGALLPPPPVLDGSSFTDAVAFSSDSRWLAVGTSAGAVQLLDARTGQVQVTLRAPGSVHGMGVAPGGRSVALSALLTGGLQMSLWDGGPAARPLELGADAPSVGPASNDAGLPAQILVFSPDGSRLVAARGGPTAYVWDVARQKAVRLDGHKQQIVAAAFSPDGKLVLTASRDHTVGVWDAARGALLRRLSGHTGGVAMLAISATGSWAASTSDEETGVRLWGLVSGRQVELEAQGLQNNPLSALFSPDGRYVLAREGMRGKVPQVFTTDLNELKTLARQRVTRTLTPEEREHYLAGR